MGELAFVPGWLLLTFWKERLPTQWYSGQKKNITQQTSHLKKEKERGAAGGVKKMTLWIRTDIKYGVLALIMPVDCAQTHGSKHHEEWKGACPAASWSDINRLWLWEKKLLFLYLTLWQKILPKWWLKKNTFKKNSLKLSCSLSIFCSPASQSRLGTWEWKKERVVQMEGRSDRIVGELQTSQTRVLESLPYAVIHA